MRICSDILKKRIAGLAGGVLDRNSVCFYKNSNLSYSPRYYKIILKFWGENRQSAKVVSTLPAPMHAHT